MYKLPDYGAWINPTQDRIIAAVGAGGKSSFLEYLALILKQSGRRVLLSTTTQMLRPDTIGFGQHVDRLIDNDLAEQLHKPAPKASLTVVGLSMDNPDKLAGLETDIFTHLIQHDIYDNVLIEADGSRSLPLKAPSAHEPVLPEGCQTVVAVTGWTEMNQPVSSKNVHRWAEFSNVTGLSTGDRVTPQAMHRLLTESRGLFKNAPDSSRRIWLINQVDTIQARQDATGFARAVRSLSPPTQHYLLSSFQNPSLPYIEEVPMDTERSRWPISDVCRANQGETL